MSDPNRMRDKSRRLFERCMSPDPAEQVLGFEALRGEMERQVGHTYSTNPDRHLFLEEGINNALRSIHKTLHPPASSNRQPRGPNDPESFLGWCMVVARNAVRARWRGVNRESDVPRGMIKSLDEPGDQEGESPVLGRGASGTEGDPELELLYEQALEACGQAMGAVTEMSKEVLTRLGIIKMNAQETAADLGIPISSVYDHSYENRATLRKKRPDLIEWIASLNRRRRGGGNER